MLIFLETSSEWFKKQCKFNKIKLNKIGLNNNNFYSKCKWKPGFYIINLSQTLPGTHWTAIAIPENKKYAIYFDSYGVIPDDKVINSLKKQNIKKIYFSNYAIQSINSKACGHYCLVFMLDLKNDPTFLNFENFINMFTPYSRQNEFLLLNMLKNKIK